MTDSELKAVRIGMGMSQQEFGQFLGYAESSAKSHISRMEAGKIPIPERVEIRLGMAEGPTRGPEWVCGHDENGREVIAHLQNPQFSATVDADTGIHSGLSVSVPETGEKLCNFIWHGPEPSGEELTQVCSEAARIWIQHNDMLDADDWEE